MNNKFIRCLIFTFIICFSLAGCAEKKDDMDITKIILSQFEEFTRIPRPSYHEEKISNYLKSWAESRGYTVTQDAYNNIIFDVPATKGYETLPLVGLQCHMDMVFVQKDGLNLDPLTTAITVVNDGIYLKTDGRTSLGADDGMGIAIILCIADGKMNHGPLRLIITTDEESSLTGTSNLDPGHFSDIKYLINLDSETEGELCVSSACADVAHFTVKYAAASQTKEKTYKIDIKGLTGGHSGIEIGKNLLNGAMETGFILNTIQNSGIDFELKSVNGGIAKNAIVSSASAVICIDESDTDKLVSVVNKCFSILKDKGALTDPDMKLDLAEIKTDENTVLPADGKNGVLTFFKEYKNGVRSMSPSIEGLVESSSNLGIIHVSPTGFEACIMSRSCNTDREKQHLDEQKELAENLNYSIEISTLSDPWEYKPGNELEKRLCESYKALFGTDMKKIAIHAGLECGTYAKYNDKMDMVSLGPTIQEAHSINEKVEIASILKVWNLLEKGLTALNIF